MNAGLTAIVPVRGGEGGKTRLSGFLDARERSALVRELADRVLTAVLDSSVADRVVVLTRDAGYAAVVQDTLPEVDILVQPDVVIGLNAGLDFARDACPAAAHLVVFADLPLIRAGDIRAFAESGAGVTICPDRHGTGTNALLLRGEQSSDFQFAFGTSSHARHVDEALRLGLNAREEPVSSLRFDLDTVDDWCDLPVPVRIDLARRIGMSDERAGVDGMLASGVDGERFAG